MTDEMANHPGFAYRPEVTDLISHPVPRNVIIAPRRWMEPYHRLEEHELGRRHHAAREFRDQFLMWMRAIALFSGTFVGKFDWPDDVPAAEQEAMTLRVDLIALAAGSSKPTLDALLAGYYWTAGGQIRSLLETVQRVMFIRLQREKALKFFQIPKESPVGRDGKRLKKQPILRFEEMQKVFEKESDKSSEEDKVVFNLVDNGVTHFNWGSHPSAEGTLQLIAGDEPYKVFGPTYNRYFTAFFLKWGILALILLLEELQSLRPQDAVLKEEILRLGNEYKQWQLAYNEEFVSDERLLSRSVLAEDEDNDNAGGLGT